VHVAGTNGKGSVVAMCDSVLRAKGLRVGRYTSPHLIDFRERVLVDGAPISEENVLRLLQRMMPLAEKIGATFFELTTALAFSHFSESNVDVAVVETGLGGRLDSTNVLEPIAATVTSIGLDHTDLLGDTLEKIAAEKAGIFKADAAAIIGEPNPAIAALLKKSALEAGARPVRIAAHEFRISQIALGATGTSFVLDTKLGLRPMRTRLVGKHQAGNAAIAIATLGALGAFLEPDWTEIERGLSLVTLPGRYQTQGKYIFDVAHNPDAARALAETMIATAPPRPRTALVAVLADKDWRGVLRELAHVVDSFIVTMAPSAPAERAWRSEEAAAFIRELGIRVEDEPDFTAALGKAAKGAATVLVTGSFHTVGDAMSRLQVSPFAA
jgi:dihydrofolate synthase/folylpolyglutamate synthase